MMVGVMRNRTLDDQSHNGAKRVAQVGFGCVSDEVAEQAFSDRIDLGSPFCGDGIGTAG